MPKLQKLREAKQVGYAIRKARIAKGEALTNISGIFKISIMELNAIEDGNLYFFQNDYAVFMKKALEISDFLGLDLKNPMQSQAHVRALVFLQPQMACHEQVLNEYRS